MNIDQLSGSRFFRSFISLKAFDLLTSEVDTLGSDRYLSHGRVGIFLEGNYMNFRGTERGRGGGKISRH